MRFKVDENLPSEAVHLLSVMPKLIAALASHPLEGRVWIVEESRIRIRGEDR